VCSFDQNSELQLHVGVLRVKVLYIRQSPMHTPMQAMLKYTEVDRVLSIQYEKKLSSDCFCFQTWKMSSPCRRSCTAVLTSFSASASPRSPPGGTLSSGLLTGFHLTGTLEIDRSARRAVYGTNIPSTYCFKL
jgi:hypothetical protein